MAMCMYLDGTEKSRMLSVTDKELNELYQEIRQVFKDKYLLAERRVFNKRLFRPLTTTVLYSVWNMLSDNECQILNFPQEHQHSINAYVSRSYIITYFYGLLNGLKYK